MTYDIAKAKGANVTYGWLLTQVASGGPANAGVSSTEVTVVRENQTMNVAVTLETRP